MKASRNQTLDNTVYPSKAKTNLIHPAQTYLSLDFRRLLKKGETRLYGHIGRVSVVSSLKTINSGVSKVRVHLNLIKSVFWKKAEYSPWQLLLNFVYHGAKDYVAISRLSNYNCFAVDQRSCPYVGFTFIVFCDARKWEAERSCSQAAYFFEFVILWPRMYEKCSLLFSKF